MMQPQDMAADVGQHQQVELPVLHHRLHNILAKMSML
jgi:hypothetical protein